MWTAKKGSVNGSKNEKNGGVNDTQKKFFGAHFTPAARSSSSSRRLCDKPQLLQAEASYHPPSTTTNGDRRRSACAAVGRRATRRRRPSRRRARRHGGQVSGCEACLCCLKHGKSRTLTSLFSSPLSPRPAQLQRHLLARSDGSAAWTAGATRVLAAVHGPRATLARCEHATSTAVSATWTAPPPAGASPDADQSASLAAMVAGAARGAVRGGASPRTAVTVSIVVTHDDGATLAFALNAASTALTEAGVPLRHTLAAAAVAVTKIGGLIVDPSAAEEAAASAVATFAFAARVRTPGAPTQLDDGGATGVHVRGRLTDDQLVAAEALARGAACAVAALARAGLEKSLGVV